LQMVHKSMIDSIKIKSSVASKQRDECFVNEIGKYKQNLFRMAKSILHNDADAEDAVGETIYKAYRKLGSIRSLNSFRPWIMKILVNECYATAKRQSRVEYLDKMENVADRVQDSTQTSFQELWSVVYQLEQEFSTVVILFYYEDLSIKEIARVLGLVEGTVKSRLARARQKLKYLLESEGGCFNGSI
jgi:RNA polymerase sigma-70 factor, ECF subfamily